MTATAESTHPRAETSDRRNAGQEGIDPASRRHEPRQFAKPDRRTRFEQQIEPTGLERVRADQWVIRSGHPRILQADIHPVARHRFELRTETGTDEVAKQAALLLIRMGRIKGGAVGHAAADQAPAEI